MFQHIEATILNTSPIHSMVISSKTYIPVIRGRSFANDSKDIMILYSLRSV